MSDRLIKFAVRSVLVLSALTGSVKLLSTNSSESHRLVAIDASGNNKYYLNNLSDNSKRVTLDSPCFWPEISTDGRYAIIGSKSSEYPNIFDIKFVDIDNGIQKKLFSTDQYISQPSFSPTGREITFEENSTIHIFDMSTGKDKELTKGELPSWSPDGTSIVYQNYKNPEKQEIHVINVKTNEDINLYYPGFMPTYTPLGDISFFYNGNLRIVTEDGKFKRDVKMPSFTTIFNARWITNDIVSIKENIGNKFVDAFLDTKSGGMFVENTAELNK